MVACLCGYFFLWLYLQCTIVRQKPGRSHLMLQGKANSKQGGQLPLQVCCHAMNRINLIDVYTAAENGNTQEVKDGGATLSQGRFR